MRAGAVFLTAAALALLAAQIAAQPAPKKIIAMERAETKTDGKLKVASPAFKEGQTIPDRYVQAGENRSPALKWSGAPAETKSFVLILEDPDAPRPQPFLHWTLYNIPATTAALPEGIPAKEKLDKPAGALQGRNGARRIGYAGPRPPQGNPPHRYFFQVFALDIAPGLDPGLDLAGLLKAMSGHVLAKGQTVGTFQTK